QLISLRSSIDPNCKGTAIFIKAKFIIRYLIPYSSIGKTNNNYRHNKAHMTTYGDMSLCLSTKETGKIKVADRHAGEQGTSDEVNCWS
ncbi:MAG: hypothetical protein JXO49_01345, partial [Deltaproteobacteria bacterium]|nr:hypothetical protein [Candidatus Anaeroferrophillus wilburensis]MBN2887972.1 hypothetical protein [Deltaproteobacteria bacterium]